VFFIVWFFLFLLRLNLNKLGESWRDTVGASMGKMRGSEIYPKKVSGVPGTVAADGIRPAKQNP
jgi:hypothetical protein